MKWSVIGKIEAMCVSAIFAVMFGFEIWSHIENQQFHWWTVPFALIALSAIALAIYFLHGCMFDSLQEEKP